MKINKDFKILLFEISQHAGLICHNKNEYQKGNIKREEFMKKILFHNTQLNKYIKLLKNE